MADMAPREEESEQIKKLRSRIRHKGAAIVAFMNSPIGKSVIEALEDEFYHGELLESDPYKTAYNLGRRDVVTYMKQLQRISEKEDDAPGTA